mgnify:CR=1 FL=1
MSTTFNEKQQASVDKKLAGAQVNSYGVACVKTKERFVFKLSEEVRQSIFFYCDVCARRQKASKKKLKCVFKPSHYFQKHAQCAFVKSEEAPLDSEDSAEVILLEEGSSNPIEEANAQVSSYCICHMEFIF